MYATSGVQSQRSALLLCGALLYYSDQHTDLHRDDTKRTAVRVTGDHFCKCPCVCTAKKIENIKTEIKGFENHFMSAFQADVECTVLLKLRRTGYYMSYRETLLLMNMEYIHLTATAMLF